MDGREAKKWGLENFDGLFARVLELEHPLKLLKELIETQVDLDATAAIALSKEHLRGSDGRIDFPRGLQSEALKQGWETTFEYFKDSWREGNSSSSWISFTDLPEDFDFVSFAASWKEHEASLNLEGNKGGYYSPPTGIWDAWSKKDPQAAFDFLISGGSETYDFDDFSRAIKRVRVLKRSSSSPRMFSQTLLTQLEILGVSSPATSLKHRRIRQPSPTG
jgi:hypothetical protein